MNPDDEVQREEEIAVGGGLWVGCMCLGAVVFWLCVAAAALYLYFR